MERWIRTQEAYYEHDAKRVYYLSLEFLMGRTLGNSLINLGLVEQCHEAVVELGYDLEALREAEWDAGLGNGGLGRLAACFLDSLATLELPSYGYGLRYDYGIFHQRIVDGAQVETPDGWLRYGNPWEIARPGDQFTVKLYGRVEQHVNERGPPDHAMGRHRRRHRRSPTTLRCPVTGTRRSTRCACGRRGPPRSSTSATSTRATTSGRWRRRRSPRTSPACCTPTTTRPQGRELRLKQEYFFVSATMQDVVRRYKKHYHMYDRDQGLRPFDRFAERTAIQLNDTHPALAIPELMRILVDVEGLGWEEAWGDHHRHLRIHQPHRHAGGHGALDGGPPGPRAAAPPADHLRDQPPVPGGGARAGGATTQRCRRMSIIEEGGEQRVRMAHLAIVGSHSVNGVAALHSEILKSALFRDFFELWPEKFNNKTNGITQRRWLKKANPGLSALVTEAIGEGWVTDLVRAAGPRGPRRGRRFRRALAGGEAGQQGGPGTGDPRAIRAPRAARCTWTRARCSTAR